jgi:cytoskeletal protein RodZ
MTDYILYIGNGLRRLRKEKKKTQLDLALDTKLQLKYIYKLKKHKFAIKYYS